MYPEERYQKPELESSGSCISNIAFMAAGFALAALVILLLLPWFFNEFLNSELDWGIKEEVTQFCPQLEPTTICPTSEPCPTAAPYPPATPEPAPTQVIAPDGVIIPQPPENVDSWNVGRPFSWEPTGKVSTAQDALQQIWKTEETLYFFIQLKDECGHDLVLWADALYHTLQETDLEDETHNHWDPRLPPPYQCPAGTLTRLYPPE